MSRASFWKSFPAQMPVVLKMAFVTSQAEFDATTAPNMDVKVVGQPHAAKLEKDSAPRFTGTLVSYDQTQPSSCTGTRQKLTKKDLPKEKAAPKKPPVRKPAARRPAQNRRLVCLRRSWEKRLHGLTGEPFHS